MVTALQGSQPQVASNRNTEVQGVWNTERGDCKNDEGRDLSRTVGGIRGVRPGALARRGELLLGGRGHRRAIHHRGELEELGRAREPALIALVWVTGSVKVAAGLLALALVRPWGRAFPRWMLLAAAWGGAALLIAYGGLFTLGGLLVVAGAIPASVTADWTTLRWHAFFWDPSFLLWGVLLAAAAHQAKTARRSRNGMGQSRRWTTAFTQEKTA
jgi:hypothetical protein